MEGVGVPSPRLVTGLHRKLLPVLEQQGLDVSVEETDDDRLGRVVFFQAAGAPIDL
jgi:hypothetical protein